jgi:ketosteroid isomerase-like protein
MADQILPLLNEQFVAANAHDTDRFLATYDHSPELIFIANGQLIRGWDNLHDQQIKWWKNGKSDVVYVQRSQPEITSLDAQTLLVTQQMTSHRTSPDGKPTDSTFIVSTIWRKLRAGWRVTYGHESWTR